MLKIELDEERDTVKIEGMKYSQHIFRQFSGLLPLGRMFTLLARRPDGVIVVKEVTQTPAGDDDLWAVLVSIAEERLKNKGGRGIGESDFDLIQRAIQR